MQYFSRWSPVSSPNRPQKEQRERQVHVPPQIERTKMKSEPSKPLLSEAMLLGNDLENRDRQNGEQDLQSKLDKNPYEALARHRSDIADRQPSTPDPAMDVTTASIHPSEGSAASPYQGAHKSDEDDELDTPHNENENPEEESSQTTFTVPGLDMTFAEALTSSPKSPDKSTTEPAQEHEEPGSQEAHYKSSTETIHESEEPGSPTRDRISPTLHQPDVALTEESDQTAIPSSPTSAPPRRRSLLPPSLQTHNKRLSTGSMSVHFSPTSVSPPSSSQSNTVTPASSNSQLDRIQTLLTKTATQLHALERVQAANWERVVSMLMENAQQIAELRRGQEQLGRTCEELRRAVEAGVERGREWERYDIRRPPRKMGKKIVGYVYEKNGEGKNGGEKTIVMERKVK